MKLSEMKQGNSGIVQTVGGTEDFERRISAVGVTPGSKFFVMQNEKKYPLLLQVRNTLLAVDRTDCGNIEVEEA